MLLNQCPDECVLARKVIKKAAFGNASALCDGLDGDVCGALFLGKFGRRGKNARARTGAGASPGGGRWDRLFACL